MSPTNIVLIVLALFTGWDVITSYYGILSVFVGFNINVIENLTKATIAQQITSLFLAVALMTTMVCYRAILKARNWLTTGLLFVAFSIDLLTSFYGSASATINDTGGVVGLQWFLVFIFALITTLCPIFIYQVFSATGREDFQL